MTQLTQPQHDSRNTHPIGRRLKAARKKAGLSQCQLAIQANTTAMHIMDMENGYNDFEGKLESISNALNCYPTWLETGTGCFGPNDDHTSPQPSKSQARREAAAIN